MAYKGNLNEVVAQFVGGLRAGMGYCGAKRHQGFAAGNICSHYNAGMRESHAHDVEITKEAPNYSRKNNSAVLFLKPCPNNNGIACCVAHQ